MVIGIDFDGTINNMIDTWVEWLNRKHGTTVRVSEITEWELIKVFPSLSTKELFEPLDTPEFWDEVTIKPDAQEVIKKLIQDGHKIYIVTSSHYKTLPYKLKKCLFANFPFLDKEDVIITYNKSLIRCDLLIDDAEHNFINFQGIKVIFDAPYNKDASIADFRVFSWKDIDKLVMQLQNIIT